MKEIRPKQFEYYENEAAYFAYIHNSDEDPGSSYEEYEVLDGKVIEFVKERGAYDRANNNPKLSFEQLSGIIISEGWLTRDQTNKVIFYLFLDYLRSYNGDAEAD